jgi:hypothetical protein
MQLPSIQETGVVHISSVGAPSTAPSLPHRPAELNTLLACELV